MNIFHRVIYGAKDLAEKGGTSSANSIHLVRLQLVVFSGYFFLPPMIMVLFSYQAPDEYIIYLCIVFALVMDSITGAVVKKVDLNQCVSASNKKKNMWVIYCLYLLMPLTTWLYMGVIAS
ncbi:hypothetical protein [Colwellia psychrerythraea]|uniref:hypothetical protein n=1 Tax=Colwellia psychrerythraea TaxID=28229 RepID=UPI00051A63B4|nr:hypothetical protein [Colwellia psychrerythraea]